MGRFDESIYFISGHYCEFAVYVPTECDAGTYMPYGNDSATGSGIVIGRLNRNKICLYEYRV